MIETDIAFWIPATIAILLTGIAKAGFGGAGASLCVPLMALAIAPAQAAAITLPVLIVMDLVNVYAFRGTWDRETLKRVLPAATLGIVVGALALAWMDPDVVRVLLGAESVVFALQRLWADARGVDQPARRPGVARGWLWGGVSGFTSCVAHAGGPPILQYVLPLKLAPQVQVGTLILFFTYVNLAKVPFYAGTGLFDASALWTAAALVPLVPVGTWVGRRLLTSLSPKAFARATTWLLLLTGIQLLVQGLL